MSKVLDTDHGITWIGVASIGVLLIILGSVLIVCAAIGLAYTLIASVIDAIDHAISQTLARIRRKPD